MPRFHKSAKDHRTLRGQDQNAKNQAGDFACPVCGSDRYYLILHAEARSNRSGLTVRCGNCNASKELFGDSPAPG